MTETLHISGLDATRSPRHTALVVLFTIEQQILKVVTVGQNSEPFRGCHVLPGDEIRPDESLETTAGRVLADQLGLIDLATEQIHTFSAADRDPRCWSVATAYLALAPCDLLDAVAAEVEGLHMPAVIVDEPTGTVQLVHNEKLIGTGFDHGMVIQLGLLRLRDMLDRSRLPFDLLPRRFTLHELQLVHEAILGRALNKPHFRKKWHQRILADGSKVTPTGHLTSGRNYRPAELYRLTRPAA